MITWSEQSIILAIVGMVGLFSAFLVTTRTRYLFHKYETRMPLTGQTTYDTYMVVMSDGVDTFFEYVLAPDVERAAWQAMELSTQRDLQLKNVIRQDEW